MQVAQAEGEGLKTLPLTVTTGHLCRTVRVRVSTQVGDLERTLLTPTFQPIDSCYGSGFLGTPVSASGPGASSPLLLLLVACSWR